MKDKQKWVKRAFHGYWADKARLPKLRDELANIDIPGCGSGDPSKPFTSGSAGNGVEKSVLQYLAEKERISLAIKDCENRIALVDKTLEHFSVEELAKGRKQGKYIRCRFLRGMSYTRAANECEISESTAGYWLTEIMTVAYAIAEMEGYI